MLGYEAQELTGRPLHALIHHTQGDGSPYPREECPIYAAFKEGGVRHVTDEVFWRKDGKSFPVEYISTPIREDGQILGAVVTFKDITERKWAEQERARLLQETQRNLGRIRALHEIDLAIMSTLDLRSVLNVFLEQVDVFFPFPTAVTIRLVNKSSGQLEHTACWNLNEEEWRREMSNEGTGLARIVVESKDPLVIANVQTDPRSRQQEFHRKHRLVSCLGVPLSAKGETLGTLILYTKEQHEFSPEEIEFVKTLAGQASIAIYNAQLYEDLKAQAAELERSNKVKDEFLSVMSHELRTPLTAVTGYTAIIMDGMFGEINAEQEKALGTILARSKDLLDMINSVLYATSIEADKIHVERQEVNLRSFFDELQADYAASLKKDLTLIWDYTRDHLPIKTDGAKLKNILQNLVNNAIKFTDKGTVTISARLIESSKQQAEGSRQTGENLPTADHLLPTGRQWVEFTVADTGVGIPKEHLPIIFDKFRQVDSSETRLYGGVGMGLYIVKQFTELLGGKVEVKSEVGKGSTFTVKIPVE